MKLNRKAVAGAGLVVASSVFLVACGNGGNAGTAPTPPPATTPAVDGGGNGAAATDVCTPGSTITLDTFVNWDPAVIHDFEAAHNVTVSVNQFAQSTDLQSAMLSGLAVGGAGVGDVVTIEGDQWTAAMINPDDFVTLPEIPGRWLDWAEDEGRVGGALKGYRTDIGPLSVIYNAALLEQHGFGQYADPAAFSEWIGGQHATWDTYLDAGRQWTQATGIPWVDSISDGPLRAALRQLPAAFEDPATGQPIDLATNQPVHDIFMKFANAMTEHLGNGTPFWDGAWGSAALAGDFVTMVAPPWQIGWPLMSALAGTEQDGNWRVATVFPDGGGNWGGTFVAVTNHGTQHECSIALADWLTNDQTASRQWSAEAAFPSQANVLAAGLPNDSATQSFLGGQDYSTVLGHLADNIPSATFRGENFSWIQDDAFFNNLATVQDGINTPAAAWDAAVAYFNSRR